MAVVIETTPSYTNLTGQEVYMIRGAPQTARAEKDVLVLVMHHTAGTDSRRYLADNPRGVSATYLVGAYPDTGNRARVYKYFSERLVIPMTQGYGVLGGVPYNINRHAISIEVEGLGGNTPFRLDVLDAAAKLAASVIKDWHDARDRSLLLVGHDHVDDWERPGRHNDPHWDWTRMTQQIYQFVGGLQGNVRGWGR